MRRVDSFFLNTFRNCDMSGSSDVLGLRGRTGWSEVDVITERGLAISSYGYRGKDRHTHGEC